MWLIARLERLFPSYRIAFAHGLIIWYSGSLIVVGGCLGVETSLVKRERLERVSCSQETAPGGWNKV